MAAPTLVEAEINAGMDAAKALWHDPVLQPTAVFWLFDEDAREWRLWIATKHVKTHGLRAAYVRVRNVLEHSNLSNRIPLQRVVVKEPANRVIDSITSVINTPAAELASAGYYDCHFNGLELPGVHAYLLHSEPAGSGTASIVPAANANAQ